MEIFTIGHSTHRSQDFLELLRQREIELLADVRRYPGSRRVPWTSADELERLLAGESVGYRHLPALGGRRRPARPSANGAWRVAQFQGYADHMESPEFADGLRELESMANRNRTAVMCAEAQWWRCHRRLLSDALLVRGWKVTHVDSRGGTQEHELTEFAVVADNRIRYPPPT